MSRRTRNQYADQLARVHKPKHSFPEALEMLKREIKRRAIADGVIVAPKDNLPRYEWVWNLPIDRIVDGQSWIDGVVRANTRGEARALIKRATGLKCLPTYIQIERFDPDANCPRSPNPLA